MSFAMLLYERPKSTGNDSQKGYRERLQNEARKVFADRAMLEGAIYVRIIWFYNNQARQQGDVDNIIKPILDALKNIVYPDDDVIVKCVAEKVDLRNSRYELVETTVDKLLYQELIQALGNTASQFHVLYIEVGQVVKRQVLFGPIDGGVE